jgi:hypothetical protein
MSLVLVAGLLATGNLAFGGTDETISARKGDRLEVSNYSGTIVVRTWDRDEVRVEADHSEEDQIQIERTDGTILVHTASWSGWEGASGLDEDALEEMMEEMVGDEEPEEVDYVITVPAWIDLAVSGPEVDITVDGVEGKVKAESVEGDVRVRGGRGQVSISTIDGDLSLSQAEGAIRINAIDSDVSVLNCSGEITVDAVDGDVILEDIDATSLKVSSVDGDVVFLGTLAGGGAYRFTNHDGDVVVGLEGQPDLEVSMETHDGDIEIGFPVAEMRKQSERLADFSLGSGSGRLAMESFDGDLTLLPRSEAEDLLD